MAMEARCYRGDVSRTRMKVLKLARRDYSAIPLLCLYAAGIFALNLL
jgi:energy-coupling factor transporter transmembrane protein EcfT